MKKWNSAIDDWFKQRVLLVIQYHLKPHESYSFRHISKETGIPLKQVHRMLTESTCEEREMCLKKKGFGSKEVLRKDTKYISGNRENKNMSRWDDFKRMADELGYIVRLIHIKRYGRGKRLDVLQKNKDKIEESREAIEHRTGYYVDDTEYEEYEWRFCKEHGCINDYEFKRFSDKDLCPHCNKKLNIGKCEEIKVEYY